MSLDRLRELTKQLDRDNGCLVGNWDWDIKENELTWNRIVFQIFKIKPKDFAGTYEGFLDTVHREDVEVVKVAVDNALYKADDYCIVHRIILPDGSVKKVMEKAEVFFNANGNPVRMIGIVKELCDA